MAAPGNEIRVAAGTYRGVSYRSTVTQTVYLDKRLTIRGGYTAANWSTPDPDQNLTTLDAEGQGRVFYIIEANGATIEGFTITGGDAIGLGGVPGGSDGGGGLYVISSTATLNHNQIISNFAPVGGGGVWLDNSTARLEGNTLYTNTALAAGGGLVIWESQVELLANQVRENTGGVGGGFYLGHSHVTLTGNTIVSNTARAGGGLYSQECVVTLNGNAVTGNVAYLNDHDGGGGGLKAGGSTIILNDNLILANRTEFFGGGVQLYGGGITLTFNTIKENQAQDGGGLFLENYATMTVTGNRIIDNVAGNFAGGLALVPYSFDSNNEAVLINNVIADNQAHRDCSGLIIRHARMLHNTIARNRGGSGVCAEGSVTLTNTILVSHTLGITGNANLEATLWGSGHWANETDWAGSVSTGAVNIWGDPHFVDPDGGDYHLAISTSAAVNVGGNAEVWSDIDGEARPEGRGFDLGADEFYTTCPPDCIGDHPDLIVQDAFGDMAENAGSTFTVYVEDHRPRETFRLWFENPDLGFARAITLTTDNLGGAAVVYAIPVAAPRSEPPGAKTYRIYTSLAADETNTPVATCAPNNDPCFEVTGLSARIRASNIGEKEQQPPIRWPISSSIPIYLYGHDPNSSFTLTFNGDPASVAPGTLQFQGVSVDRIPTNSEGTNLDNDPAYYLATGHLTGPLTIASQDPVGWEIVETTVELTEATLNIAGETPGQTHPQDDILAIAMGGFAPKQDYYVIFDDGVTSPVPLSSDPSGDLFLYYVVRPGILKPDDLPYEPGDPPTPVDILVYDRNRGNNPNPIARRTFWVFTPEAPFLNVPGGSTWPAASSLTIQGRQHTAGHFYDLRLEQGDPSNPTFSEIVGHEIEASEGDLGGEFNFNYTIPATQTAGAYHLRSYDRLTPTTVVTELPLEITPRPLISIEGGWRWIPGATITINLTNHAADRPYELWLDRDNIYGQRMQLEDILGRNLFITDGNGRATISYHIPITMPDQFEPGYDLHSFLRDNLDQAAADNGQLEIERAELIVSSIELPEIIFDVPLPITLTVTNHNPVTVANHYVDVDLYAGPPRPPNLASIVPPGDHKQWLDYIPPSGTVTIQEEVVFFGRHGRQLYGRVDTSNRLVELLESNNLSSRSIPAGCPVELFDSFEGDGLAGWTQTPFGDGTTGIQAEYLGTLVMSNPGSNALSAADNGPAAGYHLMHQTVGSGPFEAIVRLDQPPANGAAGRAGLEIRADTGDTAAKFIFAVAGDGQLQLFSRAAGLPAVEEQSRSLKEALPVWLRVNRSGTDYIFSYATKPGDVPPRHWRYFATGSSPGMPDTVEVGLLNAPGSTIAYEARFGHFFVCATSAPAGAPGGDSLDLGRSCGQVEEGGHGLVVIDAANTITLAGNGSHSWTPVEVNSALGEPLLTGLEMTPDIGVDLADQSGPHATYSVAFQSSGLFYLWVAGRGPDEAGNGLQVGLNGAPVGTVDGLPTGSSPPGWVKMVGSVNITAGLNTLDLWGKEDGAQLFKLLLTNDPAFTPPADGLAQSPCAIIVEPYVPPLFQQRLDPLRYGDFEGNSADVAGAWQTYSGAAVSSTLRYEGDSGATLPNFDGQSPSISQTIGLPGWIQNDTTAILRLWKGVDRDYNGSSAATDQLYFTLRWASEPAPPAAGFDLIEPILLADGTDRTMPDLDSSNPSPDDWTEFNRDILAGIDPLSVLAAETPVRAYFYTPNPGQGTAFYLDDISLTFCTTQPEPALEPNTGRLSGRTLRFGQPIAGVLVWAYATADSDEYGPGPVFKTYSLPDGSYRFYNLPPGQYLLYGTITGPNGTFFDSALRIVDAGDDVTNVILTIEQTS